MNHILSCNVAVSLCVYRFFLDWYLHIFILASAKQKTSSPSPHPVNQQNGVDDRHTHIKVMKVKTRSATLIIINTILIIVTMDTDCVAKKTGNTETSESVQSVLGTNFVTFPLPLPICTHTHTSPAPFPFNLAILASFFWRFSLVCWTYLTLRWNTHTRPLSF